jgi:hypothetical protein
VTAGTATSETCGALPSVTTPCLGEASVCCDSSYHGKTDGDRLIKFHESTPSELKRSACASFADSSLRTNRNRFGSVQRSTDLDALDECLPSIAVIFIVGQAKRRHNAHA